MGILRPFFREWRRHPVFPAVAVGTLALGIGAPTAVFSVVQAALLRPLPYPEPDRLVQFRLEGRDQNGPVVFDALPVTVALDWARAGTTLADLALFNDRSATIVTADGPERIAGVAATPNLFDVLGVSPARGATFDAGSREVRQVVISHDTWRRHFAGDPTVVGRSIAFDGVPHVVVGVMPAGFGFPSPEARFWIPVLLDAGGGRGQLLSAVGRLAPGVQPADAAADGRRRLDEAGALTGAHLSVRTMREHLVGDVERVLWVLLAAAGFVFVTAASNVALLLLVRAAGRTRELATRLALGAGRSDLLRQLAGESAVLAIAGGLSGVLIAVLLAGVLVGLAPPGLPRLGEVQVDGDVLAFGAGLAIVACLAAGLLGGGRGTWLDASVVAAARSAVDGVSPARRARRRMRALAATGLAVTLILLAGAGLLLQSLVGKLLVDPGFTDRGASALQVSLPPTRYQSPADRQSFHARLVAQARAVPGVEAVGLTTALPYRQPSARFDFSATGIPLFPDPETTPVAEVRTVSEGFVEAMGMRLLSGRTFSVADTEAAEPAVVISERLARLHFDDRDPVGRLLYSTNGTRRIIGVVGDVRPLAEGREAAPAFYLPMRQDPGVFRWFTSVTLVVRSREPERVVLAIRSLLRSIDPDLPVFNVRPVASDLATVYAGPRFAAAIVAIFGAMALVLAAVGVFGVTTYLAGRRTREVGLRVALGATGRDIRRLILADGARIVIAGLAAGLVLAFWLARYLGGELDGVTPTDPLAIGAATLLLSATGLMAAWLPARRAARVSALDALRDD